MVSGVPNGEAALGLGVAAVRPFLDGDGDGTGGTTMGGGGAPAAGRPSVGGGRGSVPELTLGRMAMLGGASMVPVPAGMTAG